MWRNTIFFNLQNTDQNSNWRGSLDTNKGKLVYVLDVQI